MFGLFAVALLIGIFLSFLRKKWRKISGKILRMRENVVILRSEKRNLWRDRVAREYCAVVNILKSVKWT